MNNIKSKAFWLQVKKDYEIMFRNKVYICNASETFKKVWFKKEGKNHTTYREIERAKAEVEKVFGIIAPTQLRTVGHFSNGQAIYEQIK